MNNILVMNYTEYLIGVSPNVLDQILTYFTTEYIVRRMPGKWNLYETAIIENFI